MLVDCGVAVLFAVWTPFGMRVCAVLLATSHTFGVLTSGIIVSVHTTFRVCIPSMTFATSGTFGMQFQAGDRASLYCFVPTVIEMSTNPQVSTTRMENTIKLVNPFVVIPNAEGIIASMADEHSIWDRFACHLICDAMGAMVSATMPETSVAACNVPRP